MPEQTQQFGIGTDRTVHSNANRSGVWIAADILSNQADLPDETGRPLKSMCGNCGYQFLAFQNGPWEDTGHLKEVLCPRCNTAVFRDSILITIKSVAESWGPDDASQYVRDRLHERYWMGELVSETMIDNAAGFMMSEETSLPAGIVQSAVPSIEWSPYCPVCGVVDDGGRRFDFHHWDYENDVGVQICRQCHDHAHDGSRISESEFDSDWRLEAGERLVRRMDSKQPDGRYSKARLNMPEKLDQLVDDSIHS